MSATPTGERSGERSSERSGERYLTSDEPFASERAPRGTRAAPPPANPRLDPSRWVLMFAFACCILVGAAWRPGRSDASPPSASSAAPPATVAARHGPWRGGTAVYPSQDIPLRFDHRKHLALGQTCETCHAAAARSDRVEDRLLPRGDVCDGCHGESHPATEASDATACASCHVGAEGRRVPRLPDLPPANLRFSHARHAARGTGCESCHGGMREVRLATALQLPSEETCLTCHGASGSGRGSDARSFGGPDRVQPHRPPRGERSQRADLPPPRNSGRPEPRDPKPESGDPEPGDPESGDPESGEPETGEPAARDACTLCHPTRSDGRLRTAVADRRQGPPLVPAAGTPWGIAHDLGFVEDHRGIAKARPELCASCHDDASCLECHAGNVRPMRIHAGDYLSTHGLEARGMANDCQSCHRLQSDCLACHERLALSPSSSAGGQDGFGGQGGLAFHPPGFRDGVGGESHAFAAQRNLGTCASCHDEDTCLACHATTGIARPGLGVSPHGPGFADSLRCERLADANRRVCLRCHAPGDPQLSCLP